MTDGPSSTSDGTLVVSHATFEQHNTSEACWIALHGKVYDVTKFLPLHPGGGEIVAALGGKDATEDFEEIGHSMQARRDALKYEIGVLEGWETHAKGALGDKYAASSVPHTGYQRTTTHQWLHLGSFNLVPALALGLFAAAAYLLVKLLAGA